MSYNMANNVLGPLILVRILITWYQRMHGHAYDIAWKLHVPVNTMIIILANGKPCIQLL